MALNQKQQAILRNGLQSREMARSSDEQLAALMNGLQFCGLARGAGCGLAYSAVERPTAVRNGRSCLELYGMACSSDEWHAALQFDSQCRLSISAAERPAAVRNGRS